MERTRSPRRERGGGRGGGGEEKHRNTGNDRPRDSDRPREKEKWERSEEGRRARSSKNPTKDLHKRHLEKLMEHPVIRLVPLLTISYCITTVVGEASTNSRAFQGEEAKRASRVHEVLHGSVQFTQDHRIQCISILCILCSQDPVQGLVVRYFMCTVTCGAERMTGKTISHPELLKIS